MKAKLIIDDGCSSCRKWIPTFDKLMSEYGIPYVITNEVDKVSGIPMTILYDDDGNEVGDMIGNMREDIARNKLEKMMENG